jgi:hypothetical protein
MEEYEGADVITLLYLFLVLFWAVIIPAERAIATQRY